MHSSGESRILVVDDSALVLDMFKTFFGERVECVPTVADAHAKLGADETLQILFVDLNMRDGGLPFIRGLRAKYPERAVIVISGDAAVITPRLMREVGIFRCIEKGAASIDDYEEAIGAAQEHVRGGIAA